METASNVWNSSVKRQTNNKLMTYGYALIYTNARLGVEIFFGSFFEPFNFCVVKQKQAPAAPSIGH